MVTDLESQAIISTRYTGFWRDDRDYSDYSFSVFTTNQTIIPSFIEKLIYITPIADIFIGN